MNKVRVKEFFKENKYFADHDGYTVVIDDCTTIDEKINKFLEENPNIRVLDIKYCVKFGTKDNEYNKAQALLMYEVIDRKVYEKGE